MALLGNTNIGVGRKNYIINGDFRLWQRGIDTGSVASATKTYMADRFYIYHSSDGALRFAQSQSVPTIAESGHFFSDSAYILVPTADASIAAGQYAYLGYAVEGYDFRHLVASEFITLSFWVRSNITGVYCVKFGNSGADRSYIAQYTVNSASVWEKKIITIPMNFSGGTWNYTNGIGLLILFMLSCGSTFHTTANTWASGNYLATSSQVNFMSSTANEFRLNGVQLECGPNATDFEMRHISEELFLCQRYCEKSYELTVNPGTATTTDGTLFGVRANGGTVMTAYYKVSKREKVTPTLYSPVTGTAGQLRNYQTGTDQAASVGFSSMSNFNVTASSASVNDMCGVNWLCSAEL